MSWPYKHPTNGTCIEGCQMWGYCHCGCGDKTNIADRKTQRHKGVIVGAPHVFISRHYKPSLWGINNAKQAPRATCHPSRPMKFRGLCAGCHWEKLKRANKPETRAALEEWERSRYHRFQELIIGGLEVRLALRQLEVDVPSEMEMAR